MKKNILSLIISLIFPVILFSECDFQNAVFAISKSDNYFLKYAFYRNSFDSAEVNYQFGEILVGSGSNFQRVTLLNKSDFDKHAGSLSQGLDTVLNTFGDSEPFTVGQNFVVKYFGQLSAFVKCGSGPITLIGSISGGTNDWRDKYWAVGANHISDSTEFVIQIIDSATNNPIAVLDSIGVRSNPSSDLAQRYGTEPDKMNHVKILDSSLEGKRVFLRVSPRRWGPTPYGIDSKIIKSWISYSTLFEYDSLSINRCTAAVYDTLHNLMFSKMIAYDDSVFDATGLLPDETNGMPLSPEQYNFLTNRYYVPYITSQGDTLFIEKGGFHHPKIADNSGSEISNPNAESIITNLKIAPNPASKAKVKLYFNSAKSWSEVQIQLTGINGTIISGIWQGQINKGKNEIQLVLPDIYKGTYLITITQNKSILGYKKFIIEE